MRSYPNPFRSRTSEQVAHQGLDRYLHTFGADALDLLPDDLWDRPVLIRSAPGAGKTSLLRAVSADALKLLSSRRSGFEESSVASRTWGPSNQDTQPWCSVSGCPWSATSGASPTLSRTRAALSGPSCVCSTPGSSAASATRSKSSSRSMRARR